MTSKAILLARVWIVVGTNGGDISTDDRKSWQHFSSDNLNAVAFGDEITIYAVGAAGMVTKFTGVKSNDIPQRGRR